MTAAQATPKMKSLESQMREGDIEILRGKSAGFTAEEISEQTGVPKRQIEKRIYFLCQKCGYKNVTHLCVDAVRKNII